MAQINPLPVAYKDIDLSWLIGGTIREISFQEPTTWVFDFGLKTVLNVECLWRVIEREHIVFTSQDHGHKFGLHMPVDATARCTELFAKRRVAAVQLRESTADLFFEFTDHLRLEIISDSGGYETWQLSAPSGMSLIAQGGGQICKY